MAATTPDTSLENAVQKNTQSKSDVSTNPPPSIYRLGILSLGWHAHEKTMPAELLARLAAGDAIVVTNMIPLLGRLSGQDPSVKSTYLCEPSVRYITKLPREGSFCGYRNIQMLISFILGQGPGSEFEAHSKVFESGMPTVPQLQDLIEDAWDRGFNSSGRVETGGIRGTRKHIGTPEVQALFQSLGIPCQVRRFESGSYGSAFDALLKHVEAHFTGKLSSTAKSPDTDSKVHRTSLPPIYLQRPRHSLTIVGIEINKNKKRNLLVLDPGYRPSPRMVRAAQAEEGGTKFEKRVSLTPYRKGRWQLGGFKEFETLTMASD
jgi:hypothetical protein